MSEWQMGQPLSRCSRCRMHALQKCWWPHGTRARRGSCGAIRHISRSSVSLASVALTFAAPVSVIAWSSSGESLSESVASAGSQIAAVCSHAVDHRFQKLKSGIGVVVEQTYTGFDMCVVQDVLALFSSFKLCQEFWSLKTRVLCYPVAFVSVILCLAILTQYWIVTDERTHDWQLIVH